MASWLGGRKVGIFTALLSAAAAHLAFIAPDHPLTINPTEAVQLGLFLVEASSISWVTGSIRPALNRARCSEQLYRLLAENIPKLIWMARTDGQFRSILETGVAHTDPDNVFPGYIGTCVDISDRKWSEQVLRGAYDELEDQVAVTSVELAESNESLRTEAAKRKAAEATLRKWGLK